MQSRFNRRRRSWLAYASTTAIMCCVATAAGLARAQHVTGRESPLLPSRASLGVLATQTLSPDLRRAQALLEEGKQDEAILLLRRSVRLHPQDGDAHLLLGIALSMVPKRSESLRELQKAAALVPNSAVAYFSLGNAQARFENLPRAERAFEKAIELDPDFVPARISLALVLAQQKDLEGAMENLTEAVTLLGTKPAAAYPHYLLAQVLIDQGHPHRAMEELNIAIKLRPDYEQAYLSAGSIMKSLHDDAGALKAFKKAAELSPSDAAAEYQLGGAYLRTGEAAAAIGPLEQAVRMRPGDRKARYQLCQSLRIAGRTAAAEACQQKLAVLVHEEISVTQASLLAGEINNDGVRLEKAGNLTEALEKYRNAVRLNPAETVFRRNLALALCRLGHWQEGIAELNQVLKENPEDTVATKALYIALDHIKEEPGSAGRSAESAKSRQP